MRKLVFFIIIVSTILSSCINASKKEVTESIKPVIGKMTLDQYYKASPEEIMAFITQKSANPQKITFRYASVSQELNSTPLLRGQKLFLYTLKNELGDKIEISLHLNGAFGSSADDILGGIQNRSFEMSDWPLGSFSELTNAFQPLDVPYLFTSDKQAMEVLNGKAGDIMRAKCIKDTNIRPLGYFAIGMRQFTNNVREIKSPSDMKGLKIRVQNNPLHILGMKALGCAPTPIAFAELFTALQQGVVDGQENPIPTIEDMKYYEVQKYLTVSNHLFTGQTMAINESYYNELPADVRAALNKAATEGSKESLSELLKSKEEFLDRLSKKMTVYILSDNELAFFQETSKKAWPQMENLIGKEYFTEIVTAAVK